MGVKGKRAMYSIMAAVVISGLIYGSSIYAKNTLNPTELSHFFVPFPAGIVTRPGTVENPGVGSIFVRPITIDVSKRGILKRIFNPRVEGLSTHWLDNIDSKAHRIGMKFTNTENITVEWDVNAAIPWNDETHQFEQTVGPGERIRDLGVDWLFFFPDEVRAQDIWYQGTLVIYDADTNEPLTIIPVKFQNGVSNEVPKRY